MDHIAWEFLSYMRFLGTSLFPFLDSVYDYYAYPQQYDTNTSDYGSDDYDQEAYPVPSETSNDDTERLIIERNSAEIINAHVINESNGAVISHVPTESSIYDTGKDALIIDNPDYDDEQWIEQDNIPPNEVRFDKE